jgi:hypothetical protein
MASLGDDKLLAYGEELDVVAASSPGSWILSSDEDERYGTQGRPPVAVYCKAKANNADNDWNFKLDHWVFLRLPDPMRPGAATG